MEYVYILTVLVGFLVALANQQSVHYLRYKCGTNMETERISCVYQGKGIYVARQIYNTVEYVEFRRFDECSLIVDDNLPKLNTLRLLTRPGDDVCRAVQLKRKGWVKIVTGQDGDLSTRNCTQTMKGEIPQTTIYPDPDLQTTKEWPSEAQKATPTTQPPASEVPKAKDTYRSTLTPTTQPPASEVPNAKDTHRSTLTPTSQPPASHPESETPIPFHPETAPSHLESASSPDISVIMTGVAAGMSLIGLIIVLVFHKMKMIKIRQVQLPMLNVNFQDLETPSPLRPVFNIEDSPLRRTASDPSSISTSTPTSTVEYGASPVALLPPHRYATRYQKRILNL